MNNQDEPGKNSSLIIPKDTIWATIQTNTHRIQGLIFVRPERRLKDEINDAEEFIAVRDATITSPEGGDMYRCNFMLVNRNYIVWMIPMDEPGHSGDLYGHDPGE